MQTTHAAQQAIAALSCPERRQRRLDRGLTQMDVAFACGVSLPTVVRWERCIGTPTEDNVLKYATALGLLATTGGDAA